MNDVTMKGLSERLFKVVGTRPLRPDGVDKVTGRARFGADIHVPNMLIGKVLRSPHAHAHIKSIDTSKARALPGVKAVITSADLGDLPSEFIPAGEMMINYRDMTRNVMAREKVLYEGHALAAVAAVSEAVAAEALKLIAVEYEVLPHVLDVVQAMEAGAPLLHDNMYTIGVEPKPAQPSNVAKRVEFALGDVAAGFAKADVVVEREFTTKPVHQGYIEPHACLASVSEDGQAELWCTTQGQFIVRSLCAKLLGMDLAKLRVTASEIGGGFGGKTVVYLEPLALLLSRKSGHPVKMVMSRTEVFRSTGPTSGARVWVKIGATRDGRITAAEAVLKYQAGAFQGSPVQPGCMCAFAPYDLDNVKVVGFDVVVNRPKVAAYRAPGGPIAEFAVEQVIDELAQRLHLDPVELRLKNAAKEGTKAAYGPKFGPIGMVQTLEAARAHPHYRAPLKANQGRGVASGFWFNIGGETCAALNLGEDGTVTLVAGTPDIGGSRASLAMMAAEELGIAVDKVRPIIGDTSALGYNFLTGGSRVTFSSGMAVIEAARDAIRQLCERAAKIWEVAPDEVVWEDGHARSAKLALSLAEIAKTAGKTGGPIVGNAAINAQGAGPSLATYRTRARQCIRAT
jgi:CO/xanthine dehydrogenase Mo-binding subunit